MLRVMVMEAWPSISETTFTLTPSLRSRVAQVCLRSWKHRSSRTPEHSFMRLKERLRRFEGLNMEPVSFGKIGPHPARALPGAYFLRADVCGDPSGQQPAVG